MVIVLRNESVSRTRNLYPNEFVVPNGITQVCVFITGQFYLYLAAVDFEGVGGMIYNQAPHVIMCSGIQLKHAVRWP